MKINTIYTNEFTGEVFSDKDECTKSEARSKTSFINNLIADMKLIKDICNLHNYCEDCPFNNGNCMVVTFSNNYLDIVNGLQGIND